MNSILLSAGTAVAVPAATGINLPLIVLVPLVIICALAGTVGLVWVIRRFFFKPNSNKERR